MEKDELLKILKDIVELERKHNSSIANFFLDEYEWGDISEEKIDNAKELLKVIGVQNMSHGRSLSELINMIEESDADEL
jgi:hypothetical protein